ncbi:MAG: glutamate formimidoyltransferase [Candidatus Thalassarchaeaceae archaeon]|nr:glutamate formimidoyltransferase [Candidatus Thalassarchaeaceae archaeon]
MQGLVECVPNFSEGRDSAIIKAITDAMISIEGVTLLDVDMGADFNRTVVTIVGPPEQVLKAALSGTKVALERIDMTKHSGEHDRMGAVDVVPFIPISDFTMDDCVDLSIRYAEHASREFGLPVYLYAESARFDNRVRLPDIRRGEYEGLSEKLLDPTWKPDYGPSEFKPKMGVTASGARNILIAYNVNLDTDDKASANRIAGKLRTSGVIKKDEDGQKIIGDDGVVQRIPGKFESLQAAGWMFNENTAQVSMNLLDYSKTNLHSVTEAIRSEAALMGLKVTAGELVGLVPLNALLDAGRFYNSDAGDSDHTELVNAAITGLQLDVLDIFNPNERIIEWAAGSI